jgi:hypothetical protein
MGLLRILGLGKDPHIEWMAEAFGAKPGEIVVNRLYEDHPKLYRWEGEAGGVPLTFFADSNNKYRGGGTVYLGKAGPQFTGELGEYRCAFYRPPRTPAVSVDDERWRKAAKDAQGASSWSELLPEEVFEQGLGMGRFAAELDCPLDPRPVFPLLPALRAPLEAMSDAVEGICLHREGVSIGFRVLALTRESLVSDVHKGLEILRLSASMG